MTRRLRVWRPCPGQTGKLWPAWRGQTSGARAAVCGQPNTAGPATRGQAKPTRAAAVAEAETPAAMLLGLHGVMGSGNSWQCQWYGAALDCHDTPGGRLGECGALAGFSANYDGSWMGLLGLLGLLGLHAIAQFVAFARFSANSDCKWLGLRGLLGFRKIAQFVSHSLHVEITFGVTVAFENVLGLVGLGSGRGAQH